MVSAKPSVFSRGCREGGVTAGKMEGWAGKGSRAPCAGVCERGQRRDCSAAHCMAVTDAELHPPPPPAQGSRPLPAHSFPPQTPQPPASYLADAKVSHHDYGHASTASAEEEVLGLQVCAVPTSEQVW